MSDAPIFIVGTGRAGTTLLQSVLSAHSRIAITPETHFGNLSLAFGDAPLSEAPRDSEAYWRRYVANPRFADLGVSAERCRELIEREGGPGYRATLAAFLAAYGEKTGKPRIGEKSPSHWRHAAQFLDWFPDARVIGIRRDPRAQIASELGAPWMPQKSGHEHTFVRRATRLHVVARYARSWVEINDRRLPELARDPRVTLLRYEDLVREPEATVRALCDFLDETFEPAMLADRSDQHAPRPDALNLAWSSFQARHHDTARAPINAAALDKWRKTLTQREVALIEAITGEAMRRRGYDGFASSAGERRGARAAAALARALGETELAARRLRRRLLGLESAG